jgi:lysophospholipase L1-like esterase
LASVTLAPGAEIWSDPANIAITQDSDVAISVYVPQTIKPTNFHPTGLKTMYLSAPGDFTSATTLPRPARTPTTTALYFVSDLQVMASARSRVVVAFGDSITDGAVSDIDTNSSWPDLLAKRLAATADGSLISVVNVGIGSNRIVSADAAGPAGVKRFDDDVMARDNVSAIIVLEGINDISYENAPPEQLIGAYSQLIAKAHAKGIKIYGATLLPILNSRKYTPANEATRAAVNQWIRTSHAFDAVLDFEGAVKDPAQPLSIRRDVTKDFVHPTSAGYKLIADSIDLDLFK